MENKPQRGQPPKLAEPKKRTFWLPLPMIEMIEAKARELAIKPSEVVRKAIERFCK
tara:strand:+ start:267 stop:434 length:168 start_codon:yes stop_codon:yes gene_type:complete